MPMLLYHGQLILAKFKTPIVAIFAVVKATTKLSLHGPLVNTLGIEGFVPRSIGDSSSPIPTLI